MEGLCDGSRVEGMGLLWGTVVNQRQVEIGKGLVRGLVRQVDCVGLYTGQLWSF